MVDTNALNLKLSQIEEVLLEQQWLKIVNYENCNLLPSIELHVPKNTSELKLCNLKFYLIWF